MKNSKLRVLVLAAGFTLLATACGSLEIAAATVNGTKISESEVESELDTLRSEPIFGDTIRRDPDQRGQRRRAILNELIRLEIIEQEAAKLEIEVTDKQASQLIEQAARSRGLSVEELLEQENLSESEANKLASRGVRRFTLMERVITDVSVDEDEVREVYEGQEERFVDVHLERMTLKSADDARDALEAIAQSSFSSVAKERSTDDLKSKGGDMGFVPLTGLDVQVQGAISTAVEGGLTDPIEVEEGFQIYRLVERRTKSFDEVAGDISRALTQEQREIAFDSWLAEKLKGARVVVNPKYGRFDASANPPSVVPSTGELKQR